MTVNRSHCRRGWFSSNKEKYSTNADRLYQTTMAYTRWIHWICWGCQPISFALLQDNFCVSQTSVEYLYEAITGRTRKAFDGSKQEPLQERKVMTMVSSKQGQIFPILDWFEMSDGTCQLSIRNMIGGANILIRRATGKGHDYHDRNGFYTTILNAVCRKSLAFIDLYAGFPGKVHNVRVFSNSPLYLTGRYTSFENNHIPWDSA